MFLDCISRLPQKNSLKSKFDSPILDFDSTVDSKIIRALAIVLPIFHWFDYQFLSSHTYYKQYKD